MGGKRPFSPPRPVGSRRLEYGTYRYARLVLQAQLAPKLLN